VLPSGLREVEPMSCYAITVVQNPSESVADRRSVRGAFELAHEGQCVRGIGGVSMLVEQGHRPVVVGALWREWRELGGARGFRFCKGVSPQINPNHARSLLREIPPLRPAARRRSAFPVPSATSLRTAAKNAAQTSSGLRPRKHSSALGSMGPFA
jgi:hypothetical protein